MLAAGNPVVATAHPDLYALQPAGLTVGATALELAQGIERRIAPAGREGDPGGIDASWRERVARFAPGSRRCCRRSMPWSSASTTPEPSRAAWRRSNEIGRIRSG